MKLTVVGCSPAWPNPGGAQSGYLVEGSGRLLLDCGPGVLSQLRLREGWPRIDSIVISHWHLDHWGDLVPWVWGSTLGPGEGVGKPELWVPPEGKELLCAIGGRLGQREMFEDAQTFFQKTLNLGPNLIEAYYELGRASWFMGDKTAASGAWESV